VTKPTNPAAFAHQQTGKMATRLMREATGMSRLAAALARLAGRLSQAAAHMDPDYPDPTLEDLRSAEQAAEGPDLDSLPPDPTHRR